MVSFLLKDLKRSAWNFWTRWKAWRKFRCYIPPSAIIHSVEAIEIGKSFVCFPGCQVICQDPQKGSKLVIGNRVSLNTNVVISANCGGTIYIGDDVIIGPMSVLRAANHCFDKKELPIRDQGHKPGVIIVENNVWFGADVTILPNVRIGTGSIVGAGSVVTKDIPPFSIAVGSPACVIKMR